MGVGRLVLFTDVMHRDAGPSGLILHLGVVAGQLEGRVRVTLLMLEAEGVPRECRE